ncbi:MAG TPA: type I-C CRISPR-associated protein Cas8c/Csd1 [Verrucomicrobiae bacterium]|nr:type I-C CRISPR-associated protein Cas8c/Csd1 [Verrucomicrobiae bacterium]
MLLKLLYDFAESRGLKAELPFALGEVRWIIDLNFHGELIGDGLRETQEGRKYLVPKTARPTNSGDVSDFLVDDIAAVFGLNAKPAQTLREQAKQKLAAKHRDFIRQTRKAELATRHPGFAAIKKYLRGLDGKAPPFLRLDSTDTPHWMVKTASGQEVKLRNDVFTFAVNEELLIEDERVVRPYWRKVWEWEVRREARGNVNGVCLVTGQVNVPLARTHIPMITGLHKPAKGTGAGIVSGNKPAFLSYGLDQAYNAPTSIPASKAYLKALQYLSGSEDHWFWLGPAWLCFWTSENEQASRMFANLLKKSDTRTVRDFMASPWAGRPKPPTNLEKFYAVTLTAAGPRIIVKDWLQITLGEAVQNFQQWFADLAIEPIRWKETSAENENERPLLMFHLACTTIPPKQDGTFDPDKLKADLMALLYQAALKNAPPPPALLKPILNRLHSNIAKHGIKAFYDQSRFALLKLIVNRHHRRMKETHMEIQSKLPAETTDAAYNCGSLLSVLNALQRAAHEGKLQGPSIAERYFGSASTNPNAAFSVLWRLHQSHLRKLRQRGVKGQKAAYRIKESITELCSRFRSVGNRGCPELPRTFTLVEQGRFALGFYQQEAARAEAVRAWKAKQKAAGKPLTDEDVPEEELFAESTSTTNQEGESK